MISDPKHVVSKLFKSFAFWKQTTIPANYRYCGQNSVIKIPLQEAVRCRFTSLAFIYSYTFCGTTLMYTV